MVDQMGNGEMDDKSLDQILGLASQPELSSDFESRLMVILPEQTKPSAQVIAFPRRKPPNVWVMGLPLAACLVLGVWLGATGEATDILPVSTTASAMATADPLLPSGIDDIENLSPGDLS